MPTMYSPRLMAVLALTVLVSACTDSVPPDSPPPVSAVEILTPERALTVGDTLVMSARALAAGGSPIEGRTATWSSTDHAVIAVTTSGRASAVSPGTATLRATIEGKVASAQVVVSLAPVAQVEVSTTAITLAEHQSQSLTATPRDAAGRPLSGRTIVWSTQNSAVAEVDATGRVTARGVGTTWVQAEVEGRTATVGVSVSQALAASISIAPTGVVLAVGETRQLVATVRDAAGNILTGRPVTWTTDFPAVAMVSGSGLLQGTGHGYATATASSGGVSFAIGVTVANGEADAMPFDLIYHRTTPAALGEVMILGASGSAAPLKLNAGSVARQPSPSPDGNRIAFYVSMQEFGTNRQIDDIYAVDRNGMNMKQLTDEPGYDGEPAWSPDGAKIAYRRIDVAGHSSIWVMNSDGSDKRQLTPDNDGTHSFGAPAWSPDGSRIAYSVLRLVGGTPFSGIWSMARAGGDERQHTTTTTGHDQAPTWSPDGQKIAFIRTYGDDTDITMLTIATGATARLQLPGRQGRPSWSPDGRHFAYWQPVGYTGSTAIYTVRVDGTNVRLHTTSPSWGGGYDPTWIRR